MLDHQEAQQGSATYGHSSDALPADAALRSCPDDQLLHRMFEQQAARTPHAIAVVADGRHLTFGELNQRANQLAHFLRAHGVSPDALIGLCVERSFEMVVGLLGILKAGGAYVPLDPSYPGDRLSYMLEDAAPRIVLTQARLQAALPVSRAKVIAVDGGWGEISNHGSANPDPQALGLRSEHLAYVIYTSGSTGRPKGAMNEHRAVVNRIVWMQERYRLGPQDVVLQKTPFSFDVSVWEFFWTLTSGARLVMARPDGHRDPAYLQDLIEETGVTTLHFVPSMLQVFLQQQGVGRCPSLRHIVCSGEELSPSLQNRCLALLPQARLSNLYGPTECAVDVTAWECVADAECRRVPIGHPIANTQIYILDDHLEPVTAGESGRIFIGGVAVGRGYWKRPELTAERFTKDRFSPVREARMYETGDLGRWRPDGAVEYLGRNDFQVKIRGLRIELGEIEAQLATFPGIASNVVIAREDEPGEKLLVAYFTSAVPRDAIAADELRAHLRMTLPEYMVPGAFVHLDALPLNPSGKLDRSALPKPCAQALAQMYEAPVGAPEETVAAVWARVLRIERVSRHDNFFELGGHSLLLASVVGELARRGLRIDIRAAFTARTLQEFSSVIQAGSPADTPAAAPLIPDGCAKITPEMLPLVSLQQAEIESILQEVPGGVRNVQDIYPLTPLQEGILFHHLLSPEHDPYVFARLLEFATEADYARYLQAWEFLIDRHDALCSSFAWEGLERPVQIVHRRATLDVTRLPVCDTFDEAVDLLTDRMHGKRAAFNPRVPPLIRVVAVADSRSGRMLALQEMHRLAVDAVSNSVLDFELLSYQQGSHAALPPPVPYRHFIRDITGRTLERAIELFRSRLGDVDESTAPFQLFQDPAASGGSLQDLVEARRSVPPELLARVRRAARLAGVSTGTMMHLAWALVAARSTDRTDVVFGTVLSGRMLGELDAQRAVGLFINSLPIRVKLAGRNVREALAQVHAALAELIEFEHAPLAVAQRLSGVQGSRPLFTSILNYRQPRAAAASAGEGGIPGWFALLKQQDPAHYPFSISVDELADAMTLIAQVDPRIDACRVVAYWHTALQSITTALEDASSAAVLDLEVLPPDERQRLLANFRDASPGGFEPTCVHELFEARVAQAPGAIALTHQDRALTYGELNAAADRVANDLRIRGVGRNTLVGLYLERSPELVVGMLGILKAGGAYLPLDPTYPEERLIQVLSDAAPPIVLSSSDLEGRLPATGAQIVLLDEPDSWLSESAPTVGSNGAPDPQDLAYVIFTSGSTGQPKGVCIAHRQIASLVQAIGERYSLGSNDRVLQFVSPSFDVSAQEILGTLAAGATLVLRTEAWVADPGTFWELCAANRISILHLPTAFWRRLVDCAHAAAPPCVRIMAVGGERMDGETASRWLAAQRNTLRTLNEYGPTEATVTATVHECAHESVTCVPVGTPLEHVYLRVLDAARRLSPIGAIGELYIGGAGVAAGYLNRPELTAERFVSDPCVADARLYRTGDFVRWLPSGELEFVGRKDSQVKIRGFRIELAEIEAHLTACRQVREAVVVAREDADGDKRLVAYVTAATEERPEPGEVLGFLEARLPKYMVPAALVVLDALPLTSNGKIDVRELPAPDAASGGTRAFEAPATDIERALADAWKEILRIPQVGRNDNFFDLGGHSLQIVQLVDRLHRAGLRADVQTAFHARSLAELAQSLDRAAHRPFEAPASLISAECERITPDLLDLVILTQEQIDHLVRAVPGGSTNVKDIYPLTPLQEGMLFHSRLHGDGDPYVSPQLFEFPSRENLNAFLAAWRFLIDRHDVLRTCFAWDGLPRPVQIVQRRAQLPLEYFELDRTRDPLEQLKAEMRPGGHWLDLESAPLLRVRIARDPTSPRVFAILEMHHLLGDNISHQLIDAELLAFRQGRADELPPSVPYRNLVAVSLREDRRAAAEQFFTAKLEGVAEPTAPFELTEVRSSGNEQEEAEETLTGTVVDEIRRAARAARVSVAALMHAAWALVLARCAARDDIVFGTVFSGRLQGIAGADRAVGLWISTLPIRLQLSSLTARQLVERTHRELLQLIDYEQTPLELSQTCSGLDSGVPLITSIINCRQMTLIDTGDQGRKALHDWFTVHHFVERTNYPITVAANDYGERIALITFADERIGARRILDYMREAAESLARAVNTATDTAALRLAVLPASELQLTLREFNRTAVDVAATPLIHELIERQAALAPQAIALFCEGRALSYAMLNARANQLARHLRDLGVGPERLVAICMERSVEMVVALLGILKAGGAYVPLDPGYPPERLSYMLGDANPALVLTAGRLRDRLFSCAANVIALDEVWGEIDRQAASNLPAEEIHLHSDHLAYVIYTSGSTGTPKGAMNEHRAVVNRLLWMQEEYRLGDGDRVLQKTPFSFDVSVWEFFWPLMTGARMILARPGGHQDPQYLMELIEATGITTLHFVPSMLQVFLAHHAKGRCSSIRHVVCSGEELTPALASKCLEQFPQARLSNLYGPTECAVDVTAWECRPGEMDARVPIGRPIANTRIYLLDRAGEPVPLGVAGEINIAGVQVGRGYLNRPQLTAERFVPDPFSADSTVRMYKTGDLGRWRADGTLEYLGRDDTQVKIRGLRIELGEIEAHLARHGGIKEAVVLAREDEAGDKRLTAYAIPKDGAAAPSVESLRTHLQGVLPAHMVPGAFVVLEAFPLTASGKLDRRSLPAPDQSAYARRDYEAPRGEVEEILAGIWQDLLEVSRVGRNDNFFELGGHSLLVVGMIEQLRRAGIDLGLREAFEHPVLSDLASVITKGAGADARAHLVKIKADGIRIPLFLIHEISGEVLPYLQLAQRLDGVPVYGLQAGPADGGSRVSAESLAATYLKEIRSVQSRGPYRIAGWSFGGTLAYEIARQLLSAGEQVSFLGLIDCAVAERHGNPADESDVSLFARYYLQIQGVELTWQVAEELQSAATLQRALQLSQDRGYLSSAQNLQLVTGRLRQLRKFIAAGSSYRPSPLPLVVSYFAADRPDGRHDTGGWEEVLGNHLVSSTVGGNHFTILKQPHVARLAAFIDQAMERSEKSPGRPGENRAVA